MTGDLSQRCRRGPDCIDTTQHLGAWTDTPGGLCHRDATSIRSTVAHLPRDYQELSRLLAKTGTTVDTPTGGTRALPVPIRLGVLDLQAAIVHEATLWAEMLTGYHQHGTEMLRLRRAVDVLQAHWVSLLALPVVHVSRWDGDRERMSGRSVPLGSREDGVDAALNLLSLHERVEQVEGRTHRSYVLAAPCPSCEARALHREDGADVVDCRYCDRRMSWDEYQRMTNLLVAAHQAAA